MSFSDPSNLRILYHSIKNDLSRFTGSGYKERGGSTVTGYITNNSDRVIQLSTTATNAVDTARTDLQTVIKSAQNIRHYNYTEAQLKAATNTLRDLIGQTGSNTIGLENQGIYINGRNKAISAGDCFIFSPSWNDGLITVDNANIRYTINVVCTWDIDRQVNVVKSISYGSGNSTPSIQLGELDFLIACHDWETGTAAHIASLTDGTYTDELSFTGEWFGFACAGSNQNTDADGNGTVDAVVAADATKAANFVYTASAFTNRYPSVSFDGAFSINFYFVASQAPDNGMTFYYWDIETYDSVDVLTKDNATGTMDMTLAGTNSYYGVVDGIAAKEMDETVFVAGVYEVDGVEYTTGIIAYSLGKYCETIAAKDTSDQQAFAQATAVYGYYAKGYFANL